MSEGGPARVAAALGLLELGIPVMACHYPKPVAGKGQVGCSCGQEACLAAGRHPIDELTYDPARVIEWWAEDDWNLATVAGQAVDVVELAHQGRPAQVVAWLHAHQVEAGPVIDAGDGRAQFLTTVGDPESRFAPLVGGWLGKFAHGDLVMLPPSRLAGGLELLWQVSPTTDVHPPDGELLFEALRALPPTLTLLSGR